MVAKLSFVPALVAGLLFPLLAQAQDRDDTELARGLAQRGWFDLAEEICDRLEKGANKSMVNYIRAEIQLGKVDRETEFPKASQGLADAAGFLKKFLDENPTHRWPSRPRRASAGCRPARAASRSTRSRWSPTPPSTRNSRRWPSSPIRTPASTTRTRSTS